MNEPQSEKGIDFLARHNITDVEDFEITITESAGTTAVSESRHSKGGTIGEQRPLRVFDSAVHRAHTIDIRRYFMRAYRSRSTAETYLSNYPDYPSQDGRSIYRIIKCSITYLPSAELSVA